MQISRMVRHSLLAMVMLLPAASFAGVFVSVRIGPPALPVYVQPACPGDGYIWTPGYWGYGSDGYYWVPGTWVLAPQPGLLWTPGYWGWNEGAYIWHAGYWGPHVGFYGGINYGFGYFGVGYGGGYWHGGRFFYNRSVNNVTITNVHIYNRTINNVTVNRVSYNGGAGGINAHASADEQRWANERHFEPTPMQVNHENGARGNREFLASVNHGHPAIAATARPAEFHQGFTASRPEPGYRPSNQAMNRNVPRPGNSARNMDHPMAHQDANNNRGGFRNESPRPENRPAPSHASNNGRHENPPHENAPRGEKEEHGRR